jgi:hypothetical protein
MPLQSKAQQAYMAIHHPDLLKKFAKETSEKQMEHLPEHKKPRFKKGKRKH